MASLWSKFLFKLCGCILSNNLNKLFSDSSSAYFCDLIVDTPSRQLCSSADTWILCISHVKTKTFGQWCFPICALSPKQLNSLPSDICHSQSSHAFKTALITYIDTVNNTTSAFKLCFFTCLPPPPPTHTHSSLLSLYYIPSVHLYVGGWIKTILWL